MVTPKVSIIIPLFNQKKYVAEAINSCLDQTYTNIEIIVVNDGSTDNPETVLDHYKEKIKVINQLNKGLAGARNTGIRKAAGEYIQLLDADDLLEEDKIERQLQLMNGNRKRLSYCRIDVLNNKDKSISNRTTYEFEDIFSHYYLFWKPYPTPIHSLIFHRDIFEKYGLFEEDLKANEDRYFLAKLSHEGIKFKYYSFRGGLYRKHQASMNADPVFMINSIVEFYTKINTELGDEYISEKYGYSGYQIMCANCTYFYFYHIRKGTARDILGEIRKNLQKRNVSFFVEPLESRFKKNKYEKMLAACYLERYKNIFKSVFGSIKD